MTFKCLIRQVFAGAVNMRGAISGRIVLRSSNDTTRAAWLPYLRKGKSSARKPYTKMALSAKN